MLTEITHSVMDGLRFLLLEQSYLTGCMCVWFSILWIVLAPVFRLLVPCLCPTLVVRCWLGFTVAVCLFRIWEGVLRCLIWVGGSLIADTESLIDQLEIYSDVYWRVDRPVEFGVSLGHDLRVQMMRESGFDPFRGVFLLRLYGGVLDVFAGDWREPVEDERVMEWMVEPMVNRIPDLEPDVLSRVVLAAMPALDGRLYGEMVRGVDSKIAVRLGVLPN